MILPIVEEILDKEKREGGSEEGGVRSEEGGARKEEQGRREGGARKEGGRK